MEHVGRRTVVGLALGAGAIAVTGCDDDQPTAQPSLSTGTTTASEPPTTARRQPGVDSPQPRQRFAVVSVLTIPNPDDAQELLADLGKTISGFEQKDNLSVTVGVGPAVVRAAKGDVFYGAEDLPEFASDRIEDDARGGDLLLQVCADRKATVRGITGILTAIAGERATTAWAIDGYRGTVDGVGARNVLGFYDGIAVPTEPAELDADVWSADAEGITDATLCVVRRIRLDHRAFGLLPVKEQEDVIGRYKKSGAPLSGGGIDADVNLQAKSDSGVFDIPNDAHVRRAHPLFSGAGKLMLRRGYSYRAAPDDQGLAFVCFQRDLQMFVATQNSIDGGDRLFDYATTTGTASFLVLPTWTDDEPLGSQLYA